ncbi:hypothetical protein [Jiangella anatolica]|uniref:Uncharacterized protein n=1 Tax=Jiangella anatolica TaxID=2670374 RepID=A0A2W2BWT6_9ACTN|nr:hypothetical protein [Jiangella anatolica]PZF80087.1 hypothetical protein C1I92_27790 [Jiangella anatolica]
MSAPRSGPFAWSPFGAGYVVSSHDDAGDPVVDLILPASDGTLRWVAAVGPAEVAQLWVLTAPVSGGSAGPAAPAVAGGGPIRPRAADRRLTTMGGLALALGMVAVFWIALGVLLWTLLR